MNKMIAASSLLGALALVAVNVAQAQAADDMGKAKTEKCYGVSKAGKNDCAAGSHSCAGQSTKDFDKASFVALPTGACDKLAGGSTTPAK